jgi:hypothetical protein
MNIEKDVLFKELNSNLIIREIEEIYAVLFEIYRNLVKNGTKKEKLADNFKNLLQNLFCMIIYNHVRYI